MKIDIVRAWKDEMYRDSLTSEDKALLPMNPVGAFELTEEELDRIYGSSNGGSENCGSHHHHHHHHHHSGRRINSNAVLCLSTVALAFCGFGS